MQGNHFEIFHSFDATPICVDLHSHDFYEMLLFISGKVDYQVEDKTYHLRPRDIVLTNNKEIHRPIVKEGRPYDRYVLWIHPQFLEMIQEKFGDDLSLCFQSSSSSHYNLLRSTPKLLYSITMILEELIQLKESQEDSKALLETCLLTSLLIYCNQAYRTTNLNLEEDVEYNHKISDIIFYINNNLEEPLALETVADAFYISKFHLTRLFKEITGLTFHQYILKKRLNWAKSLLLEGKSATDASLSGGFNDYSHFSRTFKKEFGLSPREYMKAVKGELV